MITKTITYTDYNGVQRTEKFYFNLNKAEIMKMEMSVSGGMAEMIQRIVDAQDVPSLIKMWEDLIRRSFGVKTPDGKGFVKRQEDLDAFVATEAYSELFMELSTDTQAATDFINGIFPADLVKQMNEQGGMQALNSAN